MPLLSRMMRTAAITGRTDGISDWCLDRQSGRWAEQTVGAAFPWTRPGSAETLRELTALHQRGVVTDAELARLRHRLGV